MTRRTERGRSRGRHPARPRGPIVAPPPDAPKRWPERAWAARTVRLVAFLLPIAVSFLVALLLSRLLDTPEAFLERLGRWILIALVATGVLLAVQRVTRRLLPLAALLSLTLVFPDETPSRFGLALRGMSARRLRRRLARLDDGLGETPREAAETLLELVAALSRHDRLTRGHSERVRAYSVMIGEEMGLGPEDLDRLRWAALLHDVGKLQVPDRILNKPGDLTTEEYELVKLHTVAGRALVAPLSDWLGGAAHAVFEHHEHFAGGGYPTGVPSEDLELTSRIVSVADAFDVMTSARSYKQAASPRVARAELERCAGTQFDPAVVRAMLNISLGKLWRTMGPMSWIAQVGLFPRPLAQRGSVAGAVLAALLSLLLTGIAGATAGRGGGAELVTAAPTTTVVAHASAGGAADSGSGGGAGDGGLGDGGVVGGGGVVGDQAVAGRRCSPPTSTPAGTIRVGSPSTRSRTVTEPAASTRPIRSPRSPGAGRRTPPSRSRRRPTASPCRRRRARPVEPEP